MEAPENEALKSAAATAAKQGYAIGGVLATLYVMSRFNVPEPSFRKARFAWAEFAQGSQWNKDGGSMAVSEKTLKNTWPVYAPVAHLWAAKVLNREYPFTSSMRSAEGLSALLEVAGGVLEWGERFVPLRAKPVAPILDAAITWRPPGPARHLHSDRVPDKLLKALQKYAAPKYVL